MPPITNYITEYRWEDILTALFVLIDDTCQILYGDRNLPRVRGPEPTFADSEVITTAIWIETFHEGHEERALTDLRQHYSHLFPDLIDRSRFNRRRRDLSYAIEEIRRFWVRELGAEENDIRVIDSLPASRQRIVYCLTDSASLTFWTFETDSASCTFACA